MKINTNTLRNLGACSEYRDRMDEVLEKENAGELEISIEICQRYANEFDWMWASDHMLNHDGRTRFSYHITAVNNPLITQYQQESARVQNDFGAWVSVWRTVYGNGYDYVTQNVTTEGRESYERRLTERSDQLTAIRTKINEVQALVFATLATDERYVNDAIDNMRFRDDDDDDDD
jgi:hypothetical protein